MFEIYVEQILAPSLQAGQIVILDNLNTHTGEKIRQVIEARGCQLLFLLAYSPDFSPIEEVFSKLKAVLRPAGARTPEALQEAIGQALLTITAQDAAFLVYSWWLPLRPSFVFPSGKSFPVRSLLVVDKQQGQSDETKKMEEQYASITSLRRRECRRFPLA